MSARRPPLRPSAFSAVIALRRYLSGREEVGVSAVVTTLRERADTAALDFENGLTLHELIPDHVDFADPQVGMREALSALLTSMPPWWLRLVPYGRNKVALALNEFEKDCFQDAGLWAEPPSKEVVEWWHELAAHARSQVDITLATQGREAELRSLQYEIDRLSALGIVLAPKWTSVDSNDAGYDIHSYNPGIEEPVACLIEVKSTAQRPPRIILTRNEWNTALSYGASYIFHVWLLPDNLLVIISSDNIAKHVPADMGSGTWLDVEIELADVV